MLDQPVDVLGRRYVLDVDLGRGFVEDVAVEQPSAERDLPVAVDAGTAAFVAPLPEATRKFIIDATKNAIATPARFLDGLHVVAVGDGKASEQARLERVEYGVLVVVVGGVRGFQPPEMCVRKWRKDGE